MRKCAVVFLLCVMVLSCGAVPASAAKYNWRLASEELADSAVDLYAHEFARLLKEKSNGDIQLEVFPHGTLGTPTEMFELALNGAVEDRPRVGGSGRRRQGGILWGFGQR